MSPFRVVDRLVEEAQQLADTIVVDLHAEATSEKVAMGRHLDGLVSLVVGTHTHVQTADERIFPKGTAFLCDAGMCGPEDSVLGRDYEAVVGQFLTSMPAKFPVARGPVIASGVLVEVDPETGRAKSVKRVAERYGTP